MEQTSLRLGAVLLLAGAAVLLAACARTGDTGSTPELTMRALGQSVSGSVPVAISDQELGVEIRRRLHRIGPAATAGVTVEVSDGDVRLAGFVPRARAARWAEAAARSTPGVTSVRSDIVVRP